MFGERHADPTQRGGMMQQPPPQGASDAMSGMQRPRTARDGRPQHEKQRPKGKERKGSQRQSAQGLGGQDAKHGHKTVRQEAVETRKTEGRRYERGGASDRGRYAWGRDTVYTPTCEAAGDTDGHGSAQSGRPGDGGGDEDELLAAEMAKVKKLVLSFLAHGPKRACGDVYSLLCALHAVCTELFPPCRRTGPTGPARTSSFVFCACVERDRDQERDSDVSIFCLYGSVHSCLVHKPSSGILSNKTLSRPRSLRCRKGTPGLHRRLIGPATTSGARIVERAHPFRSRA